MLNHAKSEAMNGNALKYVLITPARNEAALISKTIESVMSQTAIPERWIIVSDGSTDETDEIVIRYSENRPWIELLRMPERRDRNFAAKVACIQAGCERVRQLSFDVIGCLDADITFSPEYFEYLLSQFSANPELGVAGTPFVEDSVQYDYRFSNIEHVSGACQLFRRECFEDIGGYVPIRGGGIDVVAVRTARMKGWKTRTFTDMTCFHHRKMGTGTTGKIRALFKLGREDYYLGGHPVWQAVRSVYQLTRKPYLIGGVMLLAGYAWAAICRVERPVSGELIEFHRHEQMQRLKKALRLI
jgi:glycosyltransferase involved in cell wall biosynthesis